MSNKNKYSVQILWSDEDNCFVATSEELPHVSAFGDTYEEALKEFRDAMDIHLEVLGEENHPQPITLDSYSGQFRVRLPRSLHRRLATSARRENVSLNTLVIKMLSESTTMTEIAGNIVREVRASLAEDFVRIVSDPANWAAGKEPPFKPIDSGPVTLTRIEA
ncbi:MAG: type II toxin-antitoxin system HicB family antitoxin [Desulfobacterales bacterium]|nr:type II toxin-antitoxin system HicB family antitoxin [Desulfobacterales bacterium]